MIYFHYTLTATLLYKKIRTIITSVLSCPTHNVRLSIFAHKKKKEAEKKTHSYCWQVFEEVRF